MKERGSDLVGVLFRDVLSNYFSENRLRFGGLKKKNTSYEETYEQGMRRRGDEEREMSTL